MIAKRAYSKEIKIDYTREELISICERGQVPYNKWMDRDSYSSQQELHIIKLCLIGDCKFEIRPQNSKDCATNEDTIWIDIFYDDWENGESWHTHYIPTEKRLKEGEGGDWY